MLTSKLKDFQVKTTKWMATREDKYDGGMLFLDAGLGKSICTISTILNTPTKTLIVCPAGLVDNWVNEFKKHTDISRLKIVKYYGQNRDKIEINDKQLVYITSYSIAAREFVGGNFLKTSLLRNVKFGRIVLDEAHYIRNVGQRIQRSSPILFLGDQIKYKWVLTATPIFNDPTDMFVYFKFLGLEGIDQKSDWTKAITKNLDGYELLNKWIEKHGMSLKKSKVLKELKSEKEHILQLKFGQYEQDFYDSLKEYSKIRIKNLVKKIKKYKKSNLTDQSMSKILHSCALVYILRLKQACDSPLLVLKSMDRLKKSVNLKDATKLLKYYNDSINTDEECPVCYDKTADFIANPCGHKCCEGCWNKMFNSNIVNCPRCREYVDDIKPIHIHMSSEVVEQIEYSLSEIKCSSKIQKTIDVTLDIVKNGEKLLIVSQWVGMLNIVRSVFDQEPTLQSIKYVSLQGDVPLKERTKCISEFQNDPNINVCFISLMSSSEGINLVSANHIIHLDSWWNNAKTYQMSSRIHRINQTKQVHVYKLQIKHSIEEQIEQLVKKKDKMASLVLSKWNIQNKANYDTSWLTSIIRLIEKPPPEEVQLSS